MKKDKEDVEHEKWMKFEKQLAVFLGEFDAAVKIADDEDRFLTPEELKQWEERLRGIWETHITHTGNALWLELFRACYNCKNRKTPTDPLMTIGIIRCQNPECEHHEKFNEMFNTIYTKRDIDRAREHMDEMLKTPEEFKPGNIDSMYGEEMEHNTDMKQKQQEKEQEKEKEVNQIMYG